MAVFYSISFATNIAEALRSRMNTGGRLEVYNGTRPATPDTAVTTQTKLIEFTLAAPTFNAPAFDAANNRVVMNGTPVADAVGLAAGIATWARMYDASGTVVYDGNVGSVSSTALYRISDTNIIPGSSIAVTAHAFVQPKA